jgi:hypothetical protein
MKRILSIDGGGSKGIIVTALLKELEIKLNIRLCETFDLISGGSVGGIVGGMISTNLVSCSELHDLMMFAVPKVFTPLPFYIPFITPKYSDKEIIAFFDKYVGKKFKMKECKTKFECTAINKIDGRNHFFKSWEEKDGELYLLDAIRRTYAAPFYFESIKENGNIWLDGGMGTEKCLLIESIIEAVRLGWINEEIHILTIGTGYSSNKLSYSQAIKLGSLGDIMYYMKPIEGGLAKCQSTDIQINAAKCMEKINNNFTFQRIDVEIEKKMDKMDKIEYVKEYEKIGKSLIDKIDISKLK